MTLRHALNINIFFKFSMSRNLNLLYDVNDHKGIEYSVTIESWHT